MDNSFDEPASRSAIEKKRRQEENDRVMRIGMVSGMFMLLIAVLCGLVLNL